MINSVWSRKMFYWNTWKIEKVRNDLFTICLAKLQV